MTENVASRTEGPAVQRFKTLSDSAALLRGLSFERLVHDIPHDLKQKFATPRFRARLEHRFLQRTGAQTALPELIDSSAELLISFGDSGLRDLIADTGAMCQFAALRQIVDQSVLADLSARLGLSLASHDARRALRGGSLDRAREIASPHPVGDDDDALVDAVLRDGVQCWTCWIHGQPKPLRSFFNALTPAVQYGSGEVATEGCQPKDCRHRAALFADRLDLAVAERNELVGKDA